MIFAYEDKLYKVYIKREVIDFIIKVIGIKENQYLTAAELSKILTIKHNSRRNFVRFDYRGYKIKISKMDYNIIPK